MELIYVKDGIIKVYVNTNNYIAKKGDVVACNSGDVHCIESIEQSVCDILVFNADIIKKFSDNYILQNYIPKESLKRKKQQPSLK